MYYRLNGLTQRLTGASSAAYNPQGLCPRVPAVCPPFVFASATKHASKTGSQVDYRASNLQRLFKKSGGVHLKREVIDNMVYRTTTGLTVGGMFYCLVALYIAAQPDDRSDK